MIRRWAVVALVIFISPKIGQGRSPAGWWLGGLQRNAIPADTPLRSQVMHKVRLPSEHFLDGHGFDFGGQVVGGADRDCVGGHLRISLADKPTLRQAQAPVNTLCALCAIIRAIPSALGLHRPPIPYLIPRR